MPDHEKVDLGEPATVVLVRHGSTEDTDARRARGRGSAGPSLNSAGRRQAGQAASLIGELRPVDRSPVDPSPGEASGWLRASRPVTVVSSPLRRARETATEIGGALGLDPVIAEDWAELGLGEWEGLTYAEISTGWPERYREWRGSTAVAPPGGESLDEVVERVGAACDRLVAANPGRTVVVVSHTAPIRIVLARALTAGPAALWRLRVDPGGIGVVRFWADGGCEVGTVNSTAHLR